MRFQGLGSQGSKFGVYVGSWGLGFGSKTAAELTYIHYGSETTNNTYVGSLGAAGIGLYPARVGLCRFTLMMESQTEKNMKHETDSGNHWGFRQNVQ